MDCCESRTLPAPSRRALLLGGASFAAWAYLPKFARAAIASLNVRVKALSDRIAQSLGNALVAPVIAYVPEGSVNPPTAHMRFPGTITVPEATFEKLLESAARSFKLHGFRDIVLLGDHGDYQRNMKAVADRLDREWAATRVRVHAIDAYYRAGEATFAQMLKRQGYRDDEIGTHAGLSDTSLAMAVDPRLANTRFNLGLMLEQQGRHADAAAEYVETLRLEGDAYEQSRAQPSHVGAAHVRCHSPCLL
jgi:creatinine amidohydrolase/Fe(II)-dependent formamide hydrolase-like protein